MPLAEGPVVVEVWGRRILDGLGFDAMLEVEGSEVCLCWFSVASELTIERLRDSRLEEPVVLRLENVSFLDGELTATERGTGDAIRVGRNLEAVERAAYGRFLEGFKALDENWQYAYLANTRQKLSEQVEDFIYELSSEAYS